MNYEEAVSYINDKNRFGSRLGLSSIGRLLELLDNPQKDLKFLHIAGTNGKGSTSAYLAHCLEEAGYDVGLFTSPYIEKFNERIQKNRKNIPDESLAKMTSLVKDAIAKMLEEGLDSPTTFEIITAIAFLYFKEEELDYVVLEVGLGGRFDSTNIIDKSLVSVITTIDIDHVEQLGNTLDKIAYQKAGIIKEGGLVVSYRQQEDAEKVIKEVAEEMNAELYFSNEEGINVIEETDHGSIYDYTYNGEKLENIKIAMLGDYQVYNSALAITTLLVLRKKALIKITNEEILRGLSKTKWMGRLEVLKRDPIFLIDGAHNVQGIEHLKKALELFDYDKLILGVGILKDKDVDNMLKNLLPMADIIITTEVDLPRKLDANELAEKVKKYNKEVYVEKDIEKAVEKSFELAGKKDLILFGGSLYLIGSVRPIVNLR